MPSPLAAAADALARSGVDLPALGLGWARTLPAVTIVPAFGLRALPGPARAVLALAFAACVLPAVGPVEAPAGVPWLLMAVGEAARGLPVALAAAVPLWAATMAGGVADALRGSQETARTPIADGPVTPMGVPLALLACAVFLTTGGPARIVTALAVRPPPAHPLLAAADDIVGGITLAVALGAPLLAASVILEVAGALVARAASPAQVHALIAPLRALGTVAVFGIVFDRLATALAGALAASP